MPSHSQLDLFSSQPSEDAADRLRFSAAIHSPHTLAAYSSDWGIFTAWCVAVERKALPATADTVEAFIMFSLRAKLRVSTVRRRLTSIAYYHRAGGFLSPITKTALAMLLGARRLLCERPRQKEAIGLDMLASMLAASGGTSAHLVRNRAILLIGFASALRRVNLVRLQMADLAESSRGVILSIRSEKQDRTGEGRVVAIPRGQNPDTCPIRALESWFGIRGRAPGPVFQGIKRNGKLNGLELHPSRVATIVKQAACRLGLDQKFFGAHSLRAGFVTAALENGVNEVMVMQQTGHKSLSSLKMYLRSRDPFRGNAAAALGL